jgi:DNA-binding SARP family transcriptional activator
MVAPFARLSGMLASGAIRSLSVRHPSVTLDFRILGPLEVVGDAGPIGLGGPRRRAVLAILAPHANRVVSIDHLGDELYGEARPATAVTQVQRQVSDLRKALGPAIETRAPGYVLRVQPGRLDLERFERLAAEGSAALARGEHEPAARALREALRLWRGPPLADLAFEPFAAAAIARLEELRLAVLERRLEAELALGHHPELVAELDALVGEHPANERLTAHLILALYRSGRQQDALSAYRALRSRLVELYGIEPTPALRDLEQSVLRQDRALDAPVQPTPVPGSTVLACARTDEGLVALVALAAPLVHGPGRELLLVRLLADDAELSAAAARVARLRARAGAPARAAAFASADAARDIARLAAGNAVDVVFVDAAGLPDGPMPVELTGLLERCPADVALLAGAWSPGGEDRVLVAFAGGEHDWAALELGAWLASATGSALRLAGPHGEHGGGSRMLAAASLAVQRTVGIDATPLLVEPAGLAAVAEGARAVVCGLPAGWRRTGVGSVRGGLVREAHTPVLLVHRGPRPGGLAPAEAVTRFTWSLGG